MGLPELDYPFDSALLLRKRRGLIKRLRQQQGAVIHKKIAILSGSTVGEIAPMLELFCLNHGIDAELWVGDYDRFYEDAVYGNDSLRAFHPDYVYIHTTCRNIQAFPSPAADRQEANAALEAAYGRFEAVWTALRESYGCTILQNNFDPLPYRLLGNGDAVLPGGRERFLTELNLRFADYAGKTQSFYLNDIRYQAALLGLDNWFDPAQWYHYKYAVSMDAVPLLCFNLANVIKSTLGGNKKAVTVDLDNTLWGGVIGDDGLEGLQLGIESPRGMAYAEVQAYLKALGETGVALCVCSKNDEAIAKTGLTHPASVLTEADFVSFHANWTDKPTNLTEILREINILPGSMVFLDDNPVERDMVGSRLPDVALLDASDPENTIRLLDRKGYFEATVLTGDDRQRNRTLRENLQREQAKAAFGDEEAYLRSLDMHGIFTDISMENAARVTQLVNKTNQFNLTTRRYTQPEVEALIHNPDAVAFCGRLTDRFGDNGIVTVLFAERTGDRAEILLWVMSCRVFRRQMEYAVFDALVARLREKGVKTLVGRYLPTAKNGLVAELYPALGFVPGGEDASGSAWRMDLTAPYENKNTVITIDPIEKGGNDSL